MAVSDCIRTCRQCGNEFKLVAGRPGRKPSKCEKCKIPVRACAGCGVSLPSGPGRPRVYCDRCKACRPNPQRRASAPKTQLESRPCCVCGAEFKSAQPRAIYCSKKCRGSAKWRRQPRRTRDAFCVVCGIEFKSYSSTGAPGGWTKCCSDVCGRVARRLRDGTHAVYARVVYASHHAECVTCGVGQWRSSRARFRCDACLEAESWVPQFRACIGCGDSFLQSARWQQRCAPDCVTPAERRQRREQRARRRAIERGAEADRIDPFVVFARDGWTCQICGAETPRRLRGQMVSRAPELDHIIPLALGGTHTWNNVQCACRECNGRKGASMPSALAA